MIPGYLGLPNDTGEERSRGRDLVLAILKNFAFILGLFILILLVNWQFKKLA
jgi:hypothetical protein